MRSLAFLLEKKTNKSRTYLNVKTKFKKSPFFTISLNSIYFIFLVCSIYIYITGNSEDRGRGERREVVLLKRSGSNAIR